MSLSELRDILSQYDTSINDNYSSLSGLRATLLESVAEGVAATMGISNTPEIYDNVELDETWWEENASSLGWTKEGINYVYTDPETGNTYMYNPKKGDLCVEFPDGSRKAGINCRLFLSGNLSDVNETVTCLKNFTNGEYHVGDTATEPRLVIVPGFSSESQGTANAAFLSSTFGDALLRSNGNTNIKHTLAGFSAGGYESLYMVSGERNTKDFTMTGYYDKLTLINISPRKINFTPEQVQNMSGLEIDIVTNYNNINESGVSITADYYNKQRGGPYLDKLMDIPDAKIRVLVPDMSHDTHGDAIKFYDYAKKCGVEVIEYPVPEDMLKKFGTGRDSSHEYGRTVLFGYYLSGNCIDMSE